MKHIIILRRVFDTIGVGTAALLADLVKDYAISQDFPVNLPIILFVVTVIVISPLISLIGTLTVNKSRWVRKTLFGREFIEGDWVDQTLRNENTFGILSITYDHGKYIIQGSDYREDGTVESSFSSTTLDCDWPIIVFGHQSNRLSPQGFQLGGLSQFTFAYIGGHITYSGWSIDQGKKAHSIINGRRLNKEEMAKCQSVDGRSGIFISMKQ